MSDNLINLAECQETVKTRLSSIPSFQHYILNESIWNAIVSAYMDYQPRYTAKVVGEALVIETPEKLYMSISGQEIAQGIKEKRELQQFCLLLLIKCAEHLPRRKAFLLFASLARARTE